jgi:hypothetical protein
MPPTDITFKELFGRDVQPLLALLLPDGAGPLEVVELNPELPATLRRVDLLVRGVCRVTPEELACDRVIALDWQVQPDSDLPVTMFLRAALAFHKYRLLVTTVLLAATHAAAALDTRLIWAANHRQKMEHDVIIVKLYEQDAERALATQQPELWILAAAMAPSDGDRVGLLARVRYKIEQVPGLSAEHRQRLLDYATLFATLEMKQADADAMIEAAAQRSQLMLDLRQSGYAQLLLHEGKAAGKAEAILTILEARQIRLSEATRTKILACKDLELLNQWFLMAMQGRDEELRQQADALKTKAA